MSRKNVDPNEKVITHVSNKENIDCNHIGVRSRGQRNRVSTLTRGSSLTRQADADRANIHNILDRYKRTGLLPHRTAQPMGEGVPTVESFHDAMNVVTKAQQSFDALPVKIRQKFDNDPAKLLAFVQDEKNKAELVELGLVKAPQTGAGDAGPPQQPAPSESPEGGSASNSEE